MLEFLYEYFVKNPREIPEIYRGIEDETNERKAADYIAGMTDRYAINLFKRLFIPKVWQGTV
jgi:dGTPase